MQRVTVDDTGTVNDGTVGVEVGVQLTRARSIWHAYLKGQLANVGKAALWWSTFGIIAVAMLNSPLALGTTRGPFNLALLLSSPLAVAAAERWSIRRLLITTTAGRLLIWSFFIPLTWIVFHNFLEWRTTLWSLFISFMFLDGVQVAFSNAVDIDCGGLDSLSSAYDLPLTDFLRYRFTTVHQLIFDSSFIFFTPPTILILVLLSKWAGSKAPSQYIPESITGPDLSVFILALGVATVFGFLSLLSLRYYIRGIPAPEQLPEQEHLAQSLSAETSRNQKDQRMNMSLWGSYKEKMAEVADGFFIVMSKPSLKWRLILLATETALEDTMVSVIIPMTALNATSFLGHTSSKTVAALVSVIVIAVGKLAGVLAGIYLASSWSYDNAVIADRNRLFQLVLLSSLSLVWLPLGYGLAARGLEGGQRAPIPNRILDVSIPTMVHWVETRSGVLGCFAFLLGVFLFFILSTGPKIGFASLIQSLVTHEDDITRVFGFVGMFVTVTDGLMIIFVNLLLSEIRDFRLGLWVVVALYALHGLLEYLFGAQLIKESPRGRSGSRSDIAYGVEYD